MSNVRDHRPLRFELDVEGAIAFAILLPSAVGKLEAFVLFRRPSRAYMQNQGLDVNHDGQVTKGEAAAKVQTKLERGLETSRRG